MKIKTAIHPAAWIPRWTRENAPRALDAAARLGFDHVVVPLRRPEDIDPSFIAMRFAEFGMTPVNTASMTTDADISSEDPTIWSRGLDRLRTSVRLARDMGSPQIGGVLYAPLGKRAELASPSMRERAATGIRTVAEEAKQAGVRLALEIVNRYETNLFNTVAEALEFRDLVGNDNVFLHLDTFHMNVEEVDLLEAIRNAMPRLGYFELDQNHRGPLTPGLIAFAPLLEELRSLDYSGIVGIEAFSRVILDPEHADALAIWRNTYADGNDVAADGMRMIRSAFGGK